MNKELEQYFRFKCMKGLTKRGLADKPEYIERLNYEMEDHPQDGIPRLLPNRRRLYQLGT